MMFRAEDEVAAAPEAAEDAAVLAAVDEEPQALSALTAAAAPMTART